jgi:hypothetical protein
MRFPSLWGFFNGNINYEGGGVMKKSKKKVVKNDQRESLVTALQKITQTGPIGKLNEQDMRRYDRFKHIEDLSKKSVLVLNGRTVE